MCVVLHFHGLFGGLFLFHDCRFSSFFLIDEQGCLVDSLSNNKRARLYGGRGSDPRPTLVLRGTFFAFFFFFFF
jgi:hypothetical protein